jgi:hypothetical protein
VARDEARGRERAADDLQREIEHDLEGEPDAPVAHPSLRDLFRERMLQPPPPDEPAGGDAKEGGG